MSSFDRSTHKLEGSAGNQTGGLIIKKPSKNESEVEFKRPTIAPRTSLLGLDVLAKRRREQREAEEGNFKEKRLKIDSRLGESVDLGDDSGARISFGKRELSKDRLYRSSRVDTPSHPGGVSEQALERIHDRVGRKEQLKQGLYATSRDGSDRFVNSMQNAKECTCKH